MTRSLLKRFARYIALFALVVVALAFMLRQPSNYREWYAELARIPGVTIVNEHTVAIPYLRDWYLDASGATIPNYVSRTYDTRTLERVWFFMQPFPDWDALGHSFFSFDFAGEEPVIVSIEARKEVGEEEFSPYLGAVRRYELMYVWTTERDEIGRFVIGRKKPFYMYPLEVSKESAANLFMEAARRSAEVEARPQFYNTLAHNCTSILADVANAITPGTIPWTFARVFTGNADDYLIARGYIATSSIARADILDIVKTHNTRTTLSSAIRAHVLGLD